VVIEGDKINAYSGDEKVPGRTVVGIDATKKPAALDLQREGRSDVERTIYRLEGDTLRICVGRPGRDRPKEFASTAGSGESLVVLKRVKQ
jgi:uncharacterized protein (TIGR03067 family)